MWCGMLDAISSILDTDWFEEKLQDELTQIEWKLDDVERHAGRAEISLEFNYKGKLTGEAELDMLRENGQWKISGIDFLILKGHNSERGTKLDG